MNNMRGACAVFVAALGIFPGTSHAQDWALLGNNGKATIYLDKSSLFRTGDQVKVWVKWVHVAPYIDPARPKPVLVAMWLYSLKCADRQAAIVATVNFSDYSMETQAYSTQSNGDETWMEISPGSINQGVMKAVCTNP